MPVNKKLIASAVTAAVIGAGSMAATTFAATDSPTDGPASSLVQKIADKFKLNKDEVQKVFDEAHNEHKVERQKHFSERLDKLVGEGKITAEQKQKILDKFEQMKNERIVIEDGSAKPNFEQMKQKKAELQQWAKDNGIDLNLIKPEHGPRHGGMHRF